MIGVQLMENAMEESIQCIDHGTPIGLTICSEQGRITPYELGVYTVKNPRTYSTHNICLRYQGCAAPITMLDGTERWIGLKFFDASAWCGCRTYFEVD